MNRQSGRVLAKVKCQYEAILKQLKYKTKTFCYHQKPLPRFGCNKIHETSSMSKGELMILLDASSSMNTHSKIHQAKSGSHGFAEEMVSVGFSVGIVTFATDAKEILPPLNDIVRLHSAISRLKASGTTNMADGIRLGMDRLLACDGRRILLLVTDGVPDDTEKAFKMADEAKRLGIEVYAHGTKDADKEFLKKISSNEVIVRTVQDHLLGEGIRDMARELKQLPPGRLK